MPDDIDEINQPKNENEPENENNYNMSSISTNCAKYSYNLFNRSYVFLNLNRYEDNSEQTIHNNKDKTITLINDEKI